MRILAAVHAAFAVTLAAILYSENHMVRIPKALSLQYAQIQVSQFWQLDHTEHSLGDDSDSL